MLAAVLCVRKLNFFFLSSDNSTRATSLSRSLEHTNTLRWDSSARVISSSQRPLRSQHTTKRNNHTSHQAASDRTVWTTSLTGSVGELILPPLIRQRAMMTYEGRIWSCTPVKGAINSQLNSDFSVWRHSWRKNWVNCAVLAGNGARTNWTHCCVSTEKWLREGATLLLYMYIAYLD